MTEQMIRSTIDKPVQDSKDYGICYLLSNGKELKTAVTSSFKEALKDKGYWVAAIYEHGHPVEA